MRTQFECIGEVRNLGELNHLLFCVKREMEGAGRASYRICRQTFESERFGGTFCGMDEVIELASLFHLVDANLEEQTISTTRGGNRFLRLNSSNLYNLNENQRRMLIESLLQLFSPLSRAFDRVIEDFFFNTDKGRYELKASADRDPEKSSLIMLGFMLDLVRCDDSAMAYIHEDYNSSIARKIRIIRNPDWWDREPTEEELELSRYAEQLVAQSEIERLKSLGRADLAESVDLICERDSGYGCDIVSFEGASSSKDFPDRYIEVKSSAGKRLIFAISRTEMNKARLYKDQYCVVFVGGIESRKEMKDCLVKEIRNPAMSLFDVNRFQLDSKKIIVSEIEPT